MVWLETGMTLDYLRVGCGIVVRFCQILIYKKADYSALVFVSVGVRGFF